MNKISKQQELGSNGSLTVGMLHHEELPVTEIRSRLTGRVIIPGDPDYDQARTVYYGGFDRHPALIVRVADVSDIQTVIALARETGLELAVRSGGHSTSGFSVTEGGIVLDLSEMKALQIDPEGRTAWAETGLTAGEYTAAADDYGLATGFGDTGSVGLGGITLGGGIGYLVRKHGLTIDNLLAAEIVTADGRFLYVDAENHPDLFWAIRGGGGNFGVVSRFQFHLHPVGEIMGGTLILPATPNVIASFIAEADAAPEELSTIVNIMPAPPLPFIPTEHHGKLVLMAMMVYVGNVETGRRVVNRFRRLAQPIADMLRPMRYREMFPPEGHNFHPTLVARTMFLERIDRDVAQTICEFLESSDAPMRVAQLRVLGGAMARVPIDATAFAHRQSHISVNLAASYGGLEDRIIHQSWVDNFADALHQGDFSAYGNFMSEQSDAAVRAIYPEPTWQRLAKIKARYDPANLFRLNQNIPPAEAVSE